MISTPTKNIQFWQPFLVLQMMHMCGVTLWNVGLYSRSFRNTATSGKSDWDSEQSKSVYWVWHHLPFNDFSLNVIPQVTVTVGEYWKQTSMMPFSIWHELIISVKYGILGTLHVQQGKKISYSILYCRRPQRFKLGVLPSTMAMIVTWHWLRVGPSDIYRTRTASFKDTLIIGVQHGSNRPVLQDGVPGCILIRCKLPNCFPILHAWKVYFEG